MKIQIASESRLEMFAAETGSRERAGGYCLVTDARGRPRTLEGGPLYPPIEAFAAVPGRDLLVAAKPAILEAARHGAA